MTKTEALDKIIEPFVVRDGSLYYHTKNAVFFPEFEKCDGLNVCVGESRVTITYNRNRCDHEVSFSSLGYENIPEYKIRFFCYDLQSRMRDKFGFSGFDYSDAELIDDYLNIYQFWVKEKSVEQKLKSW